MIQGPVIQDDCYQLVLFVAFLFILCDGFSLGTELTQIVIGVTMAITMNLKVWR